MKESDEARLEEIKLAVESGVTDREFWHSRTPEERIWAVELMNRRAFGYDEHSAPKFQRVIEIVSLKRYEPRTGEAENSADLRNEQS